MKDEEKTKEQLVKKLAKLRKIIVELRKTNKLQKKKLIEQKKIEHALRESEEMYKTLVKTSPDAIAVHDLNGKVIEVSKRWLEMWDYKNAEEVVGRSGYDFLIIEEDREKAMRSHQKLLKDGYFRNLILTFKRKYGTSFIAELNATLIQDSYGNPKAVMATSRDVTERMKMQKKLKLYSEKLKNLVTERTRELKHAQKKVKSLQKQIQQSQRYPEIIGNSPKITEVIDLIHQVAPTNSTVLIYGETGSGKDLVALAIHYNSARKEGHFLVLNCASLPENLIDSELFGYAKGAFTGATQNKKGLFEAANKGTIFLNEIGEIPLNLQAKLLQVLETKQIRRLGDSNNITVDVRIIAASNKNLKEAVEKGHFREDLFYRINVLNIIVPPLRERKRDIPLLARHFLDKYCLSMNKEISEISHEAMDVLCSYPYPGNVRELENIIQRSIVMAKGPMLLPINLPDELRGIVAISEPESLADMERQIIGNALHKCKGNVSQAAKMLGIGRATLYRKMKKLNITILDNVS